jgi:sterol desaturase/sphingolipid hydroxylase (fatty acid hydroxylase superfamily)
VGHDTIVIDRRTRWAQQRHRRILGVTIAGAFAVALVVAVATKTDWLTDAFSLDKLDNLLTNIWEGWFKAVLNPWYWLLIPVLLVLEKLFPAQEHGGMVSLGGALDLVWILAAPVLNLTIVALWASLLNLAYDTWFDGAEVDLASAIGTFPTALVAFVLSDFLMWFTHWVRHKVPTFWYFHAVHHAAPTLNALTTTASTSSKA